MGTQITRKTMMNVDLSGGMCAIIGKQFGSTAGTQIHMMNANELTETLGLNDRLIF